MNSKSSAQLRNGKPLCPEQKHSKSLNSKSTTVKDQRTFELLQKKITEEK